MQENQADLLTDNILQLNTKRRKQLLPWWIKVFMWIFLVFGAIIPLVIIIGLLGYNAQLALYGFETNEPVSAIGAIITLVFIIKGITAYGLLTEKDWAIKIAIADAILGVCLCVLSMSLVLINLDSRFSFRLEILVLVPYLLKMNKIKPEWENSIQE